jgi:hypothetical protein
MSIGSVIGYDSHSASLKTKATRIGLNAVGAYTAVAAVTEIAGFSVVPGADLIMGLGWSLGLSPLGLAIAPLALGATIALAGLALTANDYGEDAKPYWACAAIAVVLAIGMIALGDNLGWSPFDSMGDAPSGGGGGGNFENAGGHDFD